MRILFLSLLAILNISILSAQSPSGRIYGSIHDESDKSPLDYASIILKNKKDQTSIGGLSDEKGKFNIEQIKPGVYTLEISYLGYNSYIQEDFKIIPPNLSINLGEVKLNSSATQLDVVEVVAEKSMFQLGGEKKIFNVDKNTISAGGNAVDAMKQIPTLDVTMDGNISLRGSENITIYINGKPTGMTADSKKAILESLPANSLESIEIITNPSSKYDADGTAGIINIVLKKNYNRGLNGTVSVGYGTKYKNNAGISLNFKKNRINFTSGFNYRFHESFHGGEDNRKNIFGSDINYFRQSDDSKFKSFSGNINLGLDIEITDKATLSFGNIITANGGPNNGLVTNDFFDANDIFYGGYGRTSESSRKGYNNTANINYFQKFKNQGQTLNTSASIESGAGRNPKKFLQINYDGDNQPTDLLPLIDSNRNSNNNLTSILQTDYTHPFKKHGELEAGAKVTYRRLINDLYADSLSRETNQTIINEDISNGFLYNEIVNAAYATFGGKYKEFTYKLGVRTEQTNIFIENNKVEGKFKNHYINFFPSVFFSQRLPKNHELQLSYSYRINRPNPWMLNPFADYDNPMNIRVGNPYLKPEYINSIELTYLKNWKSTFLSSSIYYRYRSNSFTRLKTIDPETSVSTTSWDNLDITQNTGAEIIFRSPITKWWNIMLNGNFFYNSSKGKIPGEEQDNSVDNFQWNGRAMTGFKFWKTAELQLSYRYNSKMVYIQGYIKPMHSLDIGVKKDFLKNNKATISLNAQDVFNTRKFFVHSSGANFESDVTRKWQSRVFTVNFSYKFGKPQSGTSPKRKNDNQMNDSNQMMDF
ncbi:MAG: TonB-dependent receptor [Chitinophagales bacterium]|nr:TonB-dependent receptor [Chitinophagales bacterium]